MSNIRSPRHPARGGSERRLDRARCGYYAPVPGPYAYAPAPEPYYGYYYGPPVVGSVNLGFGGGYWGGHRGYWHR